MVRASLTSAFGLLLVASFSLGAVGCGTYRVVRKTPNGGELALQGFRGQAREKALDYVASQCPMGYEIVDEGEEVVGVVARTETERRTLFGRPVTETTTRTDEQREWRVKYQCRDSSSAITANTTGPQAKTREVVVRF